MVKFTTAQLSRFWQKVNKGNPDDCWLWRGKTSDGYGRIMLGRKNYQAHSVSWIIHNGLIDDNKMIYHTCQRRACVNPNHLAAGDHASNPFIPEIKERFWDKVDTGKPDECWSWLAHINPKGYGAFKFNGLMRSASRVAWIFTYGDIPDGLNACHKCDNRRCCNPAHLFLGTALDNNRDKINKGRDRHPEGEAHPRAKFTSDDIKNIRSLSRAGWSQGRIGRKYGVSQSHIRLILIRKIWKCVD